MPGGIETLDATAVRKWCAAARSELVARRAEIDALNVYPVPDGDTGTNLLATMDSVVTALGRLAPGASLADTMAAVAHASLMGARGNSGVILSQLLRGVAEVLGPLPAAGATDLQAALKRAADLAYSAVAKPVEGTVLTVARAAADRAAAAGNDLDAVVRAACAGAAEALARTPSLLPVLAQAGVVDAGGRGLCVLLDALCSVVTGSAVAAAPDVLVPRDPAAPVAAREAGSDEYAYEVQYLLDAGEEAVSRLRQVLAGLGDSLVVVGGNGLWNVHVHVNDVGAALEAGVEAGRPHRITVTRFEDQVSGSAAAADGSEDRAVRTGRAVVAVAPGAGMVELFQAAGATVVAGGPTSNPSTQEILDAVLATRAAEVAVLPNDGNAQAAALAAAGAAAGHGVEVHVVPTRSPVQGLAAVAVHDPERSPADDAIAMSTAAASTRWGEVTSAVREAQTMAGPCRAGDVLGLVEGEVVVVGADVAAVAAQVADRLLGVGGELLTLVLGADADPALGEAVAATVAVTHPATEVEVHVGGQPHYPVLLGVE
jgi:uncharacterized protein